MVSGNPPDLTVTLLAVPGLLRAAHVLFPCWPGIGGTMNWLVPGGSVQWVQEEVAQEHSRIGHEGSISPKGKGTAVLNSSVPVNCT